MRKIASFSTLALLGAGIALTPQVAFAQQNATGSDATDPLDNADVDDVEDGNIIIVTAQGRSQEIADVPLSVNAVSGDTLQNAGAVDIRELNSVAPSLLVSSTGNEANGSARIRGIGTVGDNPGLESSVPVFIDGVYRSRSGNALSELGPIDRIEIVRGPQGTLGGRNSSAGLISVYTAPPEFDFGGHASVSYGNYDALRIEGGVNAPLSETVAARVDGVFFRRDGFYYDVINDTRVNDRDRYMVRGQMLFEPNEAISFRLIGDYSKKDEACCAATFVQPSFAPLARLSPGLEGYNYPSPNGAPLTSAQNPITSVLLALGQDPRALQQDTFNRNIYLTPGRSYEGETEDYGVSGELNWDFGNVRLTAITGYREYSNTQGSDTDYTTVDILYRTPGEFAGARDFKTFTQEVRLNGSLFNDRLDWLVGAYYAHEDLQVRDNLRFGTQYGPFVACRIVIAVNPALVSPNSTGCLSPGGRALLNVAGPGGTPALGPLTPALFQGLDLLAQVRDRGSTGDVYNQTSENVALFTHNIFHVTDTVDLTVGLRYTKETKDFDASFSNDNIFCPQQRALQGATFLNPAILAAYPAALRPTLQGIGGGLLALTCQGNSTSELNGVNLTDTRDEDEFSGTAILSWKPTPDWLVYGSYSRGYKAGGFNLDRSALVSPVAFNAATLNPAALQFDEETVNAYEVGVKYATRSIGISASAFRQEFENFQLNTFNGQVFLVQNVNACDTDLGGADRDTNPATGACAPENVAPGVITQGFELEASVNPVRALAFNFGVTYADAKYQDDLIGNDTGAPLDPALRLLPGDNLSNAPELTATSSVSWTPEIGTSGMRGLVFVNARMVGDYNTGSDLLYGKEQDGYVVVNARAGFTNIAGVFSIEAWAQNLFNKGYTQVAFNTPFVAPQQTYSAYLAEPVTYGVTARARF